MKKKNGKQQTPQHYIPEVKVPQPTGDNVIAQFSPKARERKQIELLPWDEFQSLYVREGEEWIFKVRTVIANSFGRSFLLLLQVYSSPRQADAMAKVRVIPDVAFSILRQKVEVLAKWTGDTFIFFVGEEKGRWEKGRTKINTPIWRWTQEDEDLGDILNTF